MCTLGGGRRSGGCPGEGCHARGPSRETGIGFRLGPGVPPREPHAELASGSRSPQTRGRPGAPAGCPPRTGLLPGEGSLGPAGKAALPGRGCGASAPRVFSLHLVTCGHDFPSGAARARHLMGTNLQVLTEPGGESGTRPFAPRWLSVWEGVHARRTPGSQLELVWDLFWTMLSTKWSLYHVLKKLLSAQWLPHVLGLRLCRLSRSLRLSRPGLDPHSFQDRIFLNLSVCWRHNPPMRTGVLLLFSFTLPFLYFSRKKNELFSSSSTKE